MYKKMTEIQQQSIRVREKKGNCKRYFKNRSMGGGAIGMGNTCKSMADSCQCMAKTTTKL